MVSLNLGTSPRDLFGSKDALYAKEALLPGY